MPEIPEIDNAQNRLLEGDVNRPTMPEPRGEARSPEADKAPAPEEVAAQVMRIVRDKLAESQSDTAESKIVNRKSNIEDPVPARMLNEFVYCARLFYYEFVEGVFVENADTQRGANLHQRVDTGSGALPSAQQAGRGVPAETSGAPKVEPETIHSRSVSMGSERLGVTAQARMLAKTLTGEIAEYVPLTTR